MHTQCGNSSVGRASASQAEGREFEPRLPLFRKTKTNIKQESLSLLKCGAFDFYGLRNDSYILMCMVVFVVMLMLVTFVIVTFVLVIVRNCARCATNLDCCD